MSGMMNYGGARNMATEGEWQRISGAPGTVDRTCVYTLPLIYLPIEEKTNYSKSEVLVFNFVADSVIFKRVNSP